MIIECDNYGNFTMAEFSFRVTNNAGWSGGYSGDGWVAG